MYICIMRDFAIKRGHLHFVFKNYAKICETRKTFTYVEIARKTCAWPAQATAFMFIESMN